MLIGNCVRLRAWREEDIAFFHTLRNDFNTQLTLLAQPRPQTVRQVTDWLELRTSGQDQVFFVVADVELNQAVGFVEIRAMRPIHGWGELGICLAPEVRGRHWGKEVLSLLEPFAYDVLGLRKIVLHVLASSSQALQFYEGTGYRRVGIHHGHFWHGGQYHDVAILEKELAPKMPPI